MDSKSSDNKILMYLFCTWYRFKLTRHKDQLESGPTEHTGIDSQFEVLEKSHFFQHVLYDESSDNP